MTVVKVDKTELGVDKVWVAKAVPAFAVTIVLDWVLKKVNVKEGTLVVAVTTVRSGTKTVSVFSSNTLFVDDEKTVSVEKMKFVSMAVMKEKKVDVVRMVDLIGPRTKGTVTKKVSPVSTKSNWVVAVVTVVVSCKVLVMVLALINNWVLVKTVVTKSDEMVVRVTATGMVTVEYSVTGSSSNTVLTMMVGFACFVSIGDC